MLNKVLKKAKLKHTNLDYNQISEIQIKTKNLQNEFIQSKFDFIIPDYLIDEIIESNRSKFYVNLRHLINCAIINGRISKENGTILKMFYS